MVRVLHISDLHARAAPPSGQHLLIEKLLEDVSQINKETEIDLAIFSGDCAYDGKPESLGAARSLLLDPLSELLPGREIILAPGNHDVDRNLIDPIHEQGMRDLFVDADAVAQLLSVDGARDQALLRLRGWRDFHDDWYRGRTPQPLPLSGHIHAVETAGRTIGIAALNTAWRCSGDDDFKRLLVGEEQIREAMSALADCDIRMVVMHHPLEWLVDFDETMCRQLLEANRCFVFTGHDHKSNPASQTSARGAAVYSRAGCLYESRTYPNSYTLLELDTGHRRAAARIRRWWPERDKFGVAEDLVDGGLVSLPWPDQTTPLPVPTLPTAEVLAPLTTIAREVSVIVPSLQLEETAGIQELLIPPTFWSLPDDEARAAQEFAEVSVEPVNPLDGLDVARVTIVSGSESSGVTSALLWLLDAHFREFGSRVPRYLRVDERMSSGRLAQTLLPPPEDGERVPLLIALDDAMTHERRALPRLQRFIEEHPEAHFVVGCHGDAHRDLARQLSIAVPVERVFLRPLRRKDLRALVARVYGAESRDLMRKVMAVLDSQRLPRNALNMAALVVVAAREPNLDDVNETGLFDAYVSFLLESGQSTAVGSGAMDYRLREALLERFANLLVERRTSRVSWPDAEQFVIDFVRKVGWAERGSPAKVLEAFIDSRVLVEHDGGVGFRHGALRDLFAAKWMLSNAEFASQVLADCLDFPDIVRHASGLRRDRPDILRTAGDAVRSAAGQFSGGVDLDRFDNIRPALRLLPDPLADESQQHAPEAPTEADIDAMYDELESPNTPEEDDGIRRIDTSQDASPREVLGQVYALLASVLKNSELVEDIELKARELREVIHGWGVLAMTLVDDVEAIGELTELLAGVLADQEHDKQGLTEVTEQLASMLVLALLAASLDDEVGTPRLQAALIQVLADQDFMATTLHALFAVLLYAGLGLPEWPTKVKDVFERHGNNALVASMLTQWTLFRYRTDELGSKRKSELEEFLADVLVVSDAHTAGPASIVMRSRNRTQVLESLRRGRMLAQRRLKAPQTEADMEDESENGAGD